MLCEYHIKEMLSINNKHQGKRTKIPVIRHMHVYHYHRNQLISEMLNDVNVYTLNEIKISYQNFHNLNKEPSLIKFQDCKMSRHDE